MNVSQGNLGRAGYGATLEGTWPYSYDTCDVGTLPNQTHNGQPLAATTDGPYDDGYNGALSYLPGQRFSACTCPGEDHPGPIRADGSFVGRSAPEIDIFEAQVDQGTRIGKVSQSGQWAPFNDFYNFNNATGNWSIKNATISELNGYKGGPFQQATSAISITNQSCYTQGGQCYSTYGIEYAPGDDGYITWINNGDDVWTIQGAAMSPDPVTKIGQRPVPQEPMVRFLPRTKSSRSNTDICLL
jgi:beta-glucanase (GH16 family)